MLEVYNNNFEVYDCENGSTGTWRKIGTNLPTWVFLCNLVYNESKIYDADTCGSEYRYFVIRKNGVDFFYEIIYSWWIERDPEWELKDEVDYRTIESLPFPYAAYPKINRDWMKV